MKKYYYPKYESIIYVNEQANSNYWDKLWNDKENWIEKDTKRVSLNNSLFKLFGKYVSKGAKIVEGGCGRGQFVYGLTMLGYRCVGVDYAKQTVKVLNEHLPELDIRYGDITNMSEFELST